MEPFQPLRPFTLRDSLILAQPRKRAARDGKPSRADAVKVQQLGNNVHHK
jgi:hypothetical protein